MDGCHKPKLSVSGQVRCCSVRIDARISDEVPFKVRQVGVSVRPIGRTLMLPWAVHRHRLHVSYWLVILTPRVRGGLP